LASSVSDTTENWAGYETTSGTFSGVSGSWVVPNATEENGTSADATWVGIGGVTSNDLIQTGTQNEVSPDGQVTTSAFYELLPNTSQTIPNVVVQPGDTISASINEVGTGEWSIQLNDETSGESYATSVAYNSSQSSAEWIEEDPSDGYSQIPFDNFGTVAFTNAAAAINGVTEGISDSSAQAITMVTDDNQVLAAPSALTSDGTSFTVTRGNASSGPSVAAFNRDPGSWHRRGSRIDSDYGY
jgi:hypothetical protein